MAPTLTVWFILVPIEKSPKLKPHNIYTLGSNILHISAVVKGNLLFFSVGIKNDRTPA
jgi:hypothetical protein